MEKRIIYADNAATTQVSKPVLEAMLPYLTGQYGNPSSIYALGRHAQRDIELARQQVAEALGCEPGEIFFTGCGTESDNWAIRSTAVRLGAKGKRHIVTSVFEHHAVLHTCAALEKEGFEVTYLPVSREGLLTAQQVADAIRPDTALVSIMYANNEIGTIQPISEIAAVCREKGVLFHTDAVQAVGHVPINVREQGIDMLSLSGHKLHAQKGIGALYVRKGVPLPNLLYGGAQERGRRPGTENVPAIVGLGTAITLAVENLEEKMERVTALRNRLIDGILDIPRTRLNGDRVHRVPGNCIISILGIEGEFLLLALDQLGVMASSGSACTSGSLDPSHVLLSLGLCHEVAHGSLRLSISDETTREDVEYIIWAVHQAAERGRAMSPLWEAIQAGKVDYPDI
ncbi:cysteine desulfurase NifS [Ruminococcus champanellensis]|uniref:cysteine desulfurase NifS n=1 Tax=Ruminococcus champanellensis TaxID=1161942 RepID=UPI002E769CDF|nr:cysteine desulfurase NifS [Ruminococcus champanellensis]MED9891492.1 cysteine desulfurase NifS [Ruminococcus champanellensis]